jgi:hypothetical protein
MIDAGSSEAGGPMRLTVRNIETEEHLIDEGVDLSYTRAYAAGSCKYRRQLVSARTSQEKRMEPSLSPPTCLV